MLAQDENLTRAILAAIAVFDGDNVCHGLCSNLGFSIKDRTKNIRRIGEMAKLFVEAGVIAQTAFISPLQAGRERVRKLNGDVDFIEVYVKCPVSVCESRDAKGMYKKARAGLIEEFTGTCFTEMGEDCPSTPETRVHQKHS